MYSLRSLLIIKIEAISDRADTGGACLRCLLKYRKHGINIGLLREMCPTTFLH